MQGTTRTIAALLVGLTLSAASIAPRTLGAQERGAVALAELIDGLGVNTRVLMIGAHPDDEDTFLITWLQRGRHVETAYLSLTRGDGGQNLIGNELGEALGVIRTEELLAARRIDGARQYFTRAFDFGFSKDTIDTYKHWQRDSILNDVVRVVRAFRPHVIVAVFSGTPRDGHGHHQVSGLLARAAYDIAADTVRFPIRDYGAPWTPSKFYRVARFNAQAGTLSMDVGEYSPLLGRSYGEIAGESRSQHKSQGFGALQRKGPIIDWVQREATRVNEASEPKSEKSIFDGMDTTWARFRGAVNNPRSLNSLDSLPAAIARAQSAYDPRSPWKLTKPLAVLGLLGNGLCPLFASSACGPSSGRNDLERDLIASVMTFQMRHAAAMAAVSGVSVEPIAASEVVAVGAAFPVVSTIYNRGKDTVRVSNAVIMGSRTGVGSSRVLAPGAVRVDTVMTSLSAATQPSWLTGIRTGGMFPSAASVVPSGADAVPQIYYLVDFGPKDTALTYFQLPVVFRMADPIRGELTRPVAAVPTVSVSLGSRSMYSVADANIDRTIEVMLTPATGGLQTQVSLSLPSGLRADSSSRTVQLTDAPRAVAFRVRGKLPAGQYSIGALAEVGGQTYSSGYDLIDYDHIRRQRVYHPASITLSVVDVRIPAKLRVAYIAGVGDNVAPALSQLGIPTTVIAATDLGRADLSSYSTVVIGPRAYEAHPELLAANPKLFDFARKGGVLLVQYGQFEMTQPGTMPFPITLGRPADRVTEEDAAVTIEAANAKELSYPNKIGASDFDGWVQERSLYMPRTFDSNYRTLLSMHDANEPANKGAVLIAPLGDGLYVYSTLSFFRQLPAGVPGGARLFVNLLSAKLAPPPPTP